MINISQIKSGLAKYVDCELLPNMQGLNKAIFATGATILFNKLDSVIDKYRTNDILKTLEIFDTEGNVNIELIATEFAKNIPSTGLALDFPILGQLVLYPADVETMHRYITNS